MKCVNLYSKTYSCCIGNASATKSKNEFNLKIKNKDLISKIKSAAVRIVSVTSFLLSCFSNPGVIPSQKTENLKYDLFKGYSRYPQASYNIGDRLGNSCEGGFNYRDLHMNIEVPGLYIVEFAMCVFIGLITTASGWIIVLVTTTIDTEHFKNENEENFSIKSSSNTVESSSSAKDSVGVSSNSIGVNTSISSNFEDLGDLEGSLKDMINDYNRLKSDLNRAKLFNQQVVDIIDNDTNTNHHTIDEAVDFDGKFTRKNGIDIKKSGLMCCKN
ncbi:protein S-acyltransferase [Theileria orientalis]|uniref:Protein S-acyltransferase n=1 Tax=Theileria orientalis TaxID=68886 RepID=A0A976MDD2_THEOR|nr:protein S-acyltransferase [Theileria orientalis]